MALVFGAVLACAVASAQGTRVASHIVPVQMQPADVAPAPMLAPRVLPAYQAQAGMEYLDRPQPLADGISKALGVTRQTEVPSGTLPWDVSFVVGETDWGQKFEGRWLAKEGWAFTFGFGEYGLMDCIAESPKGETWSIKGLAADPAKKGSIKVFSSSGRVSDVQKDTEKAFRFELNEEAIPWNMKAQIKGPRGRTETVIATHTCPSC